MSLIVLYDLLIIHHFTTLCHGDICDWCRVYINVSPWLRLTLLTEISTQLATMIEFEINVSLTLKKREALRIFRTRWRSLPRGSYSFLRNHFFGSTITALAQSSVRISLFHNNIKSQWWSLGFIILCHIPNWRRVNVYNQWVSLRVLCIH